MTLTEMVRLRRQMRWLIAALIICWVVLGVTTTLIADFNSPWVVLLFLSFTFLATKTGFVAGRYHQLQLDRKRSQFSHLRSMTYVEGKPRP